MEGWDTGEGTTPEVSIRAGVALGRKEKELRTWQEGGPVPSEAHRRPPVRKVMTTEGVTVVVQRSSDGL